jgi:hypothetical protein
MTARNSKGVTVCVTKGSAVPNVDTPTAIAKATGVNDNRVHIDLASTTGYSPGDLVGIPDGATGFACVDGKAWTVGEVDATGIILNGTVFSTGTLSATPSINHYDSTQMVCLCLSDLKFSAEKGTTVSVATFCDPSASIPSASTTAGTVDMGGFVDVSTADYKEIITSEADGVERMYRIMLPNNGEIIFPAIVSTLGWDIPIDGAVAWTAQLALGSRPRHLF